MMKQNGALPTPRAEAAPKDRNMEASRPFRAFHLRLLMKEREGVVNRLVQLDYSIWVLEEFFRNASS